MSDVAAEVLEARADFYLCLARAFVTPADAAHVAALRELLADDLAALCGQLDLPAWTHIEAFAREAGQLPDHRAWLQVYSAIFLAPPVVARINACYYLDGAVNGGSVKVLEDTYLSCGLARSEGFADLADHVAVQLEFAGELHRRQAGAATGEPAPAVDPGEFLYRFAAGWVGGLCADLARAQAARELPGNPYLPLALILREGVAAHARAPAIDPRERRHQQALQRARAKYAAKEMTGEVLAEIRRKLEDRGLSADHVPTAGAQDPRREAA